MRLRSRRGADILDFLFIRTNVRIFVYTLGKMLW
jgi:hypothetical protein